MPIHHPSNDLLHALPELPVRGRLWMAFSGGLDSTVLLDLLVRCGRVDPARVTALHIHHGLQAEADAWAQHCQQQCEQRGVELQVVRVAIDTDSNVEAAAREARYRVFTERLQAGDSLLLGHHADDQSETLLLRLLRGAGVRGLAAMPQSRPLGEGALMRPLLGVPRSQLEVYARQRGLLWIEDGSNNDPRFERNFLRHQVLPLLQQRWPGVKRVLGRNAALQAEADLLLQELAEEDLARCVSAVAAEESALSLPALWRLSPPRQRNLLRHWLRSQGAEVPELRQLNRWLEDLARAAVDRQPQLRWGRWCMCRYRDQLHLKSWEPGSSALCADVVEAGLQWDLQQPLRLPGGTLQAEAVRGAGLRLAPGLSVLVRLRQGGERIRPQGQAHSRTLKKLLQEASIPPWERARLPLIHLNDELVAVADRWIAEGYVAGAEELGWRLDWQPD